MVGNEGVCEVKWQNYPRRMLSASVEENCVVGKGVISNKF